MSSRTATVVAAVSSVSWMSLSLTVSGFVALESALPAFAVAAFSATRSASVTSRYRCASVSARSSVSVANGLRYVGHSAGR